MAGINIEQEYTEDINWLGGANPAYNFIHHDNDFPYTTTYPNFPFNIVITIWYGNQSNSSGFYRNAWGQPELPWVFCPTGMNPGGSTFLRFLRPDEGGLETTSKRRPAEQKVGKPVYAVFSILSFKMLRKKCPYTG